MLFISHIKEPDEDLKYSSFDRDDILHIGTLVDCIKSICENMGYEEDEVECMPVIKDLDFILSDKDSGDYLGTIIGVNYL